MCRCYECLLPQSLIAGLQQQPPGSDGFERFALELNSLQQQGATGGTRREALFSAVLRSPLLHRAVALGGSNGVLPLSLQHLLLLLQHQQTNKLTEKAKSLILGHEAVMLGCGAMRGCRGLVVAVDAVSGTALLRLPGKAEVIAVRCTEIEATVPPSPHFRYACVHHLTASRYAQSPSARERMRAVNCGASLPAVLSPSWHRFPQHD
ncbi:uncharacterized protein LOC34622475 [Cyclospora cayetanensis]|uniref:Uncharacterized protein LOC34622475 n=1 Tax=Cyclospora cayetanensis TaxID=88456 RepID=A0A6P6RYZ2_9EIME|nr:uncharacterized protein LOC34622475 [Cyclospora cayetanensis]